MKTFEDPHSNMLIVAFVLVIALTVISLSHFELTGHTINTVGDVCSGVVERNDLEGCIRTRITYNPSGGLHSAGDDFFKTSATNTSIHRIIISWYQAFDSNGNPRWDLVDPYFTKAKQSNMKIVLTLRPNHPDKSTVGFNISELSRSFDAPDSYPKNEQEWVDFVQAFTNRYYVNPSPDVEGVLVGIQIGNEWFGQFEVNNTLGDDKWERMSALMNLSYKAIKDIAPDLEVYSFGHTGLQSFALKEGFNERGWIYKGTYETGMSKVYPAEVSQETVNNIINFMTDTSGYYDILDIHLRSDYIDEPRYVANWIRAVWNEKGVEGKALSATEFGGPFHIYTNEYHDEMIRASEVIAFHAGFDNIYWASWYSTQGFGENFQQESLVNNSGSFKHPQIETYANISMLTKDFVSVEKLNESVYRFILPGGKVNDINIDYGVEVPEIAECVDGIDNDQDSLIDLEDSDCLDYYDRQEGIHYDPVNLTIIYPVSNSNYTTQAVNLEYEVQNADECYYSLNGGVNVSLPLCMNTTLIVVDGSYEVIVYGKNPQYTSSDFANFFVNTSTENNDSGNETVGEDIYLSIIHPENNRAYNDSKIDLNYTSTGADQCFYSVNLGPLIELENCLNDTITFSNGSYELLMYANNSVNETYDSALFYVILDRNETNNESNNNNTNGDSGSGGSGGGGGGGGNNKNQNRNNDKKLDCSPVWDCQWSECIDGFRETTLCKDLNECNTMEGIPLYEECGEKGNGKNKSQRKENTITGRIIQPFESQNREKAIMIGIAAIAIITLVVLWLRKPGLRT